MTKPSDFNPRRAIEVRESETPSRVVSRNVWLLRLAGVVLVVVGWATVTLYDAGTLQIAADTSVFVILGIYGFAAAAQSRRTAVSMERKLRLELLVHNMELENMAMRDDLTQLFNRRYFIERLEMELGTAKGFHRPLAVMMIDLDSIRAINNDLGHHAGDKVLAAFGSFLLGHTRASDVPARFGGDEFAVILPDTPESAARMLMERLMESLEQSRLVDDESINVDVTAAFGMSGYPWGGDSVDAILQLADASMTASKQMRLANGTSAAGYGEAAGGAIPAIFLKSVDADADSAAPED